MELIQLKVAGWQYRDVQAAIQRRLLWNVWHWMRPLGKKSNKRHILDDVVQAQLKAAFETAKLDERDGNWSIRLKVEDTWLPGVTLESFGCLYTPRMTYYALFCTPTEPKDYSYSKGAYYFLFTGSLESESEGWKPARVDKTSKKMTCLKVLKDDNPTLLQRIQAIFPATQNIIPFQS